MKCGRSQWLLFFYKHINLHHHMKLYHIIADLKQTTLTQVFHRLRALQIWKLPSGTKNTCCFGAFRYL